MDSRSRSGFGLGAFAPMGVRDRFQWGGYGFVAGLLLGLLLGVFFYGVVSFVIRYGVVILLLVPLIWLFFAWRGRRPPERPLGRAEVAPMGRNDSPVESGYVIEGRAKPVAERRER